MKKIKFVSIALGLVLFAGTMPASAATVAELQAQLNALMAQLASLQGTPGAGVVNAINYDLTMGSSGNSVVTLQTALVGQDFLPMPAGVSMGYFGNACRH